MEHLWIVIIVAVLVIGDLVEQWMKRRRDGGDRRDGGQAQAATEERAAIQRLLGNLDRMERRMSAIETIFEARARPVGQSTSAGRMPNSNAR